LIYKKFTLAYSCAASVPTTLGIVSGSGTLAWAQYAYSYTANKTFPTLSFGVSSPTNTFLYMDDVSVADTTNSSVQLLNNQGFDNSSTSLPGWDVWCSSGCSGTAGGISTANCRSGNCYKAQCGPTTTNYLVQTFPAVFGRTYNISFWMQRIKGGGAPATVTLSVGIM